MHFWHFISFVSTNVQRELKVIKSQNGNVFQDEIQSNEKDTGYTEIVRS